MLLFCTKIHKLTHTHKRTTNVQRVYISTHTCALFVWIWAYLVKVIWHTSWRLHTGCVITGESGWRIACMITFMYWELTKISYQLIPTVCILQHINNCTNSNSNKHLNHWPRRACIKSENIGIYIQREGSEVRNKRRRRRSTWQIEMYKLHMYIVQSTYVWTL